MNVPEDSSTKPPESQLTREAAFEFQGEAAHNAEYNEADLGLEQKFDTHSLEKSDNKDALGRLSNYDVLKVLGSGGMGVVFQAFDNRLGRVVALKVLNRQLMTSPIAKRRFMREARAAAAIKHDNVVTIHAVEEHNHCPFLVMEFIHGNSLRELIRERGALSPTDALKLAAQISAGLAAAHAQGVIHRDIKPANILLEDSLFRAKLSDFGLARAAFDNAELTGAGLVVGTPAYMAPEQILGSEVDPRADIFSLGCVMYAMLSGHSPFHGSSYYEVSRSITDFHPPSLHTLNPKIPRFLSDIVSKLLEKSPDDRPQSAAEVAQVLTRHIAQINQSPSDRIDRLLREQPTDVWKSRKRPRRKMLFAAAALPLLFASFLLFWKPWPAQELRVALDGSEQYDRVSKALASAGKNSVIRVTKPGVYKDSIEINQAKYEGITIIGVPGVEISSATNTEHVVLIQDVDRVTLRDLQIHTARRQLGIEMVGKCAGTTVQSCTIIQDRDSEFAAIYLHEAAAGTSAAPITFRDLEITCGNIGVVLGDDDPPADEYPVEHVVVSNCRVQCPGDGMGVSLCLSRHLAHVLVEKSTFSKGMTALSLVFDSTCHFEDVTIRGNEVFDFKNFIYAWEGSRSQGLHISDNAIKKTENLVQFESTATVKELPPTVTGNKWTAARTVLDTELGEVAVIVPEATE